MTKISIIMPVYNDEDRLDKSINSFLNQSLKDIELICVNDGSTDNSLSILENFAKKYSNIKVFTQENQGSGKARNYGLNQANGNYIGFLDADDVFMDEKALETLFDFALKNNANMVSGNIKLVDEEGNFSPFLPLEYYDKYSTILPEEYGIPWSFYKNIFKKDFLIENNIIFPDLLRGQDPVFLAEILAKMDYIYTVPVDYYAYFYVNGANQCNTRKKRFDHMMHYRMVFEYLSDSKFDNINHLFRYEMLDFIDLMGVEGGKDILDATREIFKDKPEILNNFEENFYFKHEKNKDMQKLVDFEMNPDEPRISVLIPIYNASDFLEKSIGSLLNQTFKDFELVCVNDGSKDNSLEILEKFAQKDSRVKVISKENGGCGSARNRALDEANGKYVYFFDPDDEISENTFELTYKSAIYNDSDMVIFKADIIDNDKISKERTFFDLQYPLRGNNLNRFTFDYHNVKHNVLFGGFAPWSKLYKKEFLDDYDDFKFNIGLAFDDVPFHVKSMLRAKRISFVNKFLYHYRFDNPNSVNNTSSNGFDIFKILDIVKEFLLSENFMEEFKYEFTRFEIEHCLFYVISTKSEEYYKILRERFSKIDTTLITKNQNEFDLVMETEDYLEFVVKYLHLQFKQEKHSLIKGYEKDIKKLNNENKKLKKENDKLMNSIKTIKNSKSFKLGTKFASPVRKLKKVKNDFSTSKRMRILFMPSDNNRSSGAFLSMVNLIVNLRKKYSVDIFVILPMKGHGVSVLDANNISYELIESRDWVVPMGIEKDSSYYKDINNKKQINKKAIKDIRKFIKKNKIDLVHINTTYLYVGAKAALAENIPFVWHLREFLEEGQNLTLWDRKKGNELINKANKVITVSKTLNKKYENVIDKNKLISIYDGVEADRFYKPKKTIFDDDIIKLIFVGGFEYHKGQIEFAKACVKLHSTGLTNFEVLFVGGGKNNIKQEVRDIFSDAKMDNFKIFGYKNDVEKYYPKADISFNCGSIESFGRTTVESMLSGNLVIGANVAGTKELIDDGKTGILYELGNEEDLCEKIIFAIKNKEKSREIADRGRKFMIENMTAEKNADNVYKVYKDILKK